MKNKLLKILTLILALCFSFMLITACDNSGGGDTPPEHQCEYGEWTSNGNSTHTRVCKTNGEHKQTENCSGGTVTCTKKAECSLCEQEYGELKEHVFDKEIATEKYFVSEATCTEKAKYNYSCVCGEKGSETFTVGNKGAHKFILDKCKWCEKEKVTSKGLSFTLINNDTEYEVLGIGDCTDTDIVIPSIYMGKLVTSIGEDAFFHYHSLKSIEIPNSVTNIGELAFYSCDSLTSIEIPNSVTSIGLSAFSGCYSLTNIEIPNSVTSIGDSAFSGCCSLTSVEIPNSVTSIQRSTFAGCTSLTSIEIPNSVKSIDSFAFADCESLTIITFNGTIKEWESISKGEYWNDCCPATEVICTDGTVTIN